MTNNTNATKREVLPAAGLLWIESTTAMPWSAPKAYGGERWDRQLNRVVEQAKREGIALRTDRDVFVISISGDDSPAQRLAEALTFATQHPTRWLFVPSSVFADLTHSERDVYFTTLKALNTELIFCDE